jgi:RimJ/RimL family protein N-acetyltransferase
MQQDTTITDATEEQIEMVWKERWGLPIITAWREYEPADVRGLCLLSEERKLTGLVTWFVDDERAEIVTLDSMVPDCGYGSRLLGAAEDRIRGGGLGRVSLVTTNDNLRAARFYLHCGYRLVRVHLDAMDRIRAKKPGVAEVGADGIAVRDLWELEKPSYTISGCPPASETRMIDDEAFRQQK